MYDQHFLEKKLQTELSDPGLVSPAGVEKIIGSVAERVAVHAIVSTGIDFQTATAIIHPAPLRMVEYVECFGTKFERHRFPYFEVLEQSHIKIETAGPDQGIATGITEGEAGRLRVSAGI